METVKEGCDEETSRELLKLSVGGDLGSPVEDSGLSERTFPRMFSCKICTRAFYSVKALSAHQKVHKAHYIRERYETKEKNMTKLMDIGVTRSLGVQARSFVQKSSREKIPVSTKCSESCKYFGTEVLYTLDEWSRSFHLDKNPLEEPSYQEKLDLNLNL